MSRYTFNRFRTFAALIGLAAALSACGGGDSVASLQAHSSGSFIGSGDSAQNGSSSSAQFNALMAEGARMNAEELDAAQKSASLATPLVAFEGAPKAASPLVAIYRFFNTLTGAHFYTASIEERDSVRSNLPTLHYEGVAFYASSSPARGLSPVHRFYNTSTGVHLYTISESEKTSIQNRLPVFRHEGIAYYASQVTASSTSGIRRFFVRDRGFHFYSSSPEEVARIRATLPNYVDEGPAYFALTEAWSKPVDVDLTTGSWVLTSRDNAGTSWTGSTLVFTHQGTLGQYAELSGYFDFLRNGSPYGREYFNGKIYADGRLVLSGYAVTTNSIVPTDYLAYLNVAGNQFVNGTWGRAINGGIPGVWTAAR